jgi:pimeloyl-ACP methyl ester carboxylesterase
MTNSALQSGWVIVPQVRARYESVYGVRTHYTFAGDGEPLILLHGGGPGVSGASGWASMMPTLAEHFRVYAIDQMGSGFSDKPFVDYSLQTFVEHVAGFIDSLGLKKVRLVGNSQGAYVAAKYALDQPGRVSALGLISSGNLATACGIPDGPSRAPLPYFDGSKEALRSFLLSIYDDPTKVTDALVSSRFEIASMPGHKEMLDSIQQDRKRCNEDSSLRQAWFVRDRLKELNVPFCFIWGEKDRAAPLDPLGLGLKALCPRAPFHVVPNAGHQVPNDKPDHCSRLLLGHFLKGA